MPFLFTRPNLSLPPGLVPSLSLGLLSPTCSWPAAPISLSFPPFPFPPGPAPIGPAYVTLSACLRASLATRRRPRQVHLHRAIVSLLDSNPPQPLCSNRSPSPPRSLCPPRFISWPPTRVETSSGFSHRSKPPKPSNSLKSISPSHHRRRLG